MLYRREATPALNPILHTPLTGTTAQLLSPNGRVKIIKCCSALAYGKTRSIPIGCKGQSPNRPRREDKPEDLGDKNQPPADDPEASAPAVYYFRPP